MSETLESRADLRRAFYRLSGLSESDTALQEHEAQPGDTVNGWLQQGLWEAQRFLVSKGAPNRWVTRAPLGGWVKDSTIGLRYTDLPDDFLRLAGDQEQSGLWTPNGQRWGALIQPEQKNLAGGLYFLENDRIYLTRLARPPSNLHMEYYRRHHVLRSDNPEADDGRIDFPREDRMLIVAYAAQEAADSPEFPGTLEDVARIARLVKRWKDRAYHGARRTREPRKLKHPRSLGNHWYSTGR
jgi:hypothetical protein